MPPSSCLTQRGQPGRQFGDAVEQVEVKVAEPERIKEYRNAIVEAAPGYEIRDWQQQNRS